MNWFFFLMPFCAAPVCASCRGSDGSMPLQGNPNGQQQSMQWHDAGENAALNEASGCRSDDEQILREVKSHLERRLGT
jgi:hypothetical protein